MFELHLKSFDFACLKSSLNRLHQMFNSYSIKVSYFPIHRTKFTVLRSPHIDKKARDQFELKSYKVKMALIPNRFTTLVNHRMVTASEIPYSLSLIKTAEFPGIEIKARVLWTAYLP